MHCRVNLSWAALGCKAFSANAAGFLLRIALGLALLPLLLLGGCGPGSSSSGSAQSACTQTYWVSTSGNDASGDGSETAPFLTLDRARQAVRADASRGQCAIDVNVKSGTYALSAPLKFDAGDSGAINAPVTYQAAPGNTSPVVISGGIPVTGFNCSILNICTGTVAGLPAHVLPRQFYVNDQRAIRARSNYGQLVNINYLRVTDGYDQFIPETFTHPELVEAVTVTQWKMMRCPVASMSGTSLIMANPCWNNANTFPVPWNFQLLSWLENAPEFLTEPNMWYLDPYSKQLTYYNTSSTAPQNAVLPVLESLVELVGTPDAPVSNIRFKGLQFSYATWLGPNPAAWQGAASTSAPDSTDGYVADQSGNILKGSDYSANVIGHQKVVYKTPGNITLRYAKEITFDGNTFIHLGGAALDLDTGSQNNTVVNNVFTDISSAAILVGGFTQEDMRPDSAHQTSGNLIGNNDISYTGQDYYDSAAIFAGFTTGTVITHNTINHTPWTGIAIGWGWGLFDQGSFPGLPGATRNMWGTYDSPTIQSNNEISSNLIENFLEQLWDGGAIYTNGAQGQSFDNGLTIKLNVAENKRPAAGSNIFYTDGGSQYITLEQNVTLNDPTGTVDFGPCLAGSSINSLCLGTGLISYGADMGGCLPVGDLKYVQNYFLDTIDFFGPGLCHNALIPPYPVNLTFMNNIPISSSTDVPTWILFQAGTQ